MKFNISNIKAVFAVAALGAASCTANYEGYQPESPTR